MYDRDIVMCDNLDVPQLMPKRGPPMGINNINIDGKLISRSFKVKTDSSLKNESIGRN